MDFGKSWVHNDNCQYKNTTTKDLQQKVTIKSLCIKALKL